MSELFSLLTNNTLLYTASLTKHQHTITVAVLPITNKKNQWLIQKKKKMFSPSITNRILSVSSTNPHQKVFFTITNKHGFLHHPLTKLIFSQIILKQFSLSSLITRKRWQCLLHQSPQNISTPSPSIINKALQHFHQSPANHYGTFTSHQ